MKALHSKRQVALAALLAALAAAPVEAAAPPATGSPKSAACTQALDTLREQEDRLIAAPRERVDSARQHMLQARRAAALACLGAAGDEATAPPSSRIEAPLAPPPRTAPAQALRRPATPTAVPAPPAPRTLGACDANGCWTSDGVRLQRVGPQLLGPRGFCSTAGATVQCP